MKPGNSKRSWFSDFRKRKKSKKQSEPSGQEQPSQAVAVSRDAQETENGGYQVISINTESNVGTDASEDALYDTSAVSVYNEDDGYENPTCPGPIPSVSQAFASQQEEHSYINVIA